MKRSDENRHQGLPASYIDLVEGAEGAARAAPADGKRSAAAGAAGEATRHPATAGGRREAPALDLSLGHFGTYPVVEEIDFVSDGPFTVEIDYGAMVATVSHDHLGHYTREVRRTSARKIEKLLAVAQKSGMRILREAT